MMICQEHKAAEGQRVYPGQRCPWCERDAALLQVMNLEHLRDRLLEAGEKSLHQLAKGTAALERALKTKEERDALKLQLSEAKRLIADWLQHECSVGGPSWEEIESRARAMVAENERPEHKPAAVGHATASEEGKSGPIEWCPECGAYKGAEKRIEDGGSGGPGHPAGTCSSPTCGRCRAGSGKQKCEHNELHVVKKCAACGELVNG